MPASERDKSRVEAALIRRLERLAREWPEGYMLASMGGDLCLFRSDDRMMNEGRPNESLDPEKVLWTSGPHSEHGRRLVSRPRILDLFCNAGGAGKGYHDAGFDVVGVDIEPQPNYPFEFFHADALAMTQDCLRGCWHEASRKSSLPGMLHRCLGHFDAVHASPPCQAHSDLQKQSKREYPDLIAPTRELLIASGLPYVIENVEGAPLIDPVMICGASVPGLRVIRHRLFEANFPLDGIPCPQRHPLVFTHDKRKAHYGRLDQDENFVQVTGGGNCTVANKRAAMGVSWMTGTEANEAIPPAYTEHIGKHLLAAIASTAEVAT